MARSFSELTREHPCFGSHAARTGRIHLPVCPGCNIACRFCQRSLNYEENRPGVTGRVLKPEEACQIVEKDHVCAIPGRDSAVALKPIRFRSIDGCHLNRDNAFKTFELIGQRFPWLIKCMSTNGLLLNERADEVIAAGIDSLTVTVNAVDPQILVQLNDYVVWHGKKLEGIEGAKILIQNQLEGIKKIAEAGITVKVNTVLVPRINGNHIAAIAQAVAEAGADKYNIIPLIPTAKLKDEPAPNCAQIEEARRAAGEYIEIFLHCNHCRADAAGVPGKSEISKELYRGAPAFEENFSHG